MRPLRYILLFLSLTCTSFLAGQDRELDSLWSVKNSKTESDTNRIKVMADISWNYLYSSMDTALQIAEEALKLAESLKFDKEKKWSARVFNVLGAAYMVSADYPKSLDYYFKALEIHEKNGNKVGAGNACTNIGSVYSKQGDYPNSLKFSLKALTALEGTDNKRVLANAYTRVGNVYFALQNYDRSGEYYEKGLEMMKEAGDEGGIAKNLHNIGLVYFFKRDLPNSLDYLDRSLTIFTKLENKVSMGNCYEKMGLIFQMQGDLKKGLEYEMIALNMGKEVADKAFIGSCFLNIANIYGGLKDYKAAFRYADSSLQTARLVGHVNMQRNAYESFSSLYRDAGDFRNAYEYHVKFKKLTDSIFNADNSKQLGDLKTQFEVDKKEAELKIKAEAQEAVNAEEKKRQQFITYCVVGVLLIVLIFSVMLFQRFRLTNKQKRIIEEQKEQVDHAFEQLHEKNKEVTDSINYAGRIQRALITSEKYIEKNLTRLMKK